MTVYLVTYTCCLSDTIFILAAYLPSWNLCLSLWSGKCGKGCLLLGISEQVIYLSDCECLRRFDLLSSPYLKEEIILCSLKGSVIA